MRHVVPPNSDMTNPEITALYHHHLETVSIPFGPRGCPDARRELIRMWQLPNFYKNQHLDFKGTDEQVSHSEQTMLQAVREADLYWVSAQMCDLLDAAKSTVPIDTTLTQELLPTKTGIAFLTVKIQDGDVAGAEWSHYIDAFQWTQTYIIYDRRLIAELLIRLYTYHATPGAPSRWTVARQSTWRLGDPLSQRCEDELCTDALQECHVRDRRLVLAFAALIKSPGIVNQHTVKPNRATQRRVMRAGQMETDDVHVIYLRSPQHDNEHGETESNYHHRWIVSGHWRSQPYGQGRTQRKPVWIAPHVKGPDGAPLINVEKVRAVVR